MSTSSVDDFLFSSGGKSAFPEGSEIGDVAEGVIVSATVEQQTDFNSGEPLWFDDEKTQPRQQLVVTIQTDATDDDDDGLRRFYGKGLGKKMEVAKGDGYDGLNAIKEALKAAGAKTLVNGGRMKFKQTGVTVPMRRGAKPSKLFKAVYTAPTSAIDIDDI